MATNISFSSSDAIADETEEDIDQLNIGNPTYYFQIDQCVEFIQSNDYCKVALQFPDELMSYALSVATAIENIVGRKVYVLADTSYGSCCVDEVAASHVGADAIIHFGHTCLSGTEKLPVLYVYGISEIDSDDFLVKMNEMFSDKNENILVFYEVSYCDAMSKLHPILVENYTNLIITQLEDGGKLAIKSDIAKTCEMDNTGSNQTEILVRKDEGVSQFGRSYVLQFELSVYKILFIGKDGLTLRNLMLSYNKNQFYTYDPNTNVLRRETLNVNRSLMKRYYLIEKAKDAHIVGIVMGTLGVARYKEMVSRLKTVLKQAGKQFYTFIVGKVNVAKMANFMEIDIFVFVACPENSVIDSKEYYKPIITPYEMEIACLHARNWTGDYLTDFRDLLPGSSHHVDIEEEESVEVGPEYSMITGKLRTNLKITDKMTSTDVALRSQETQLATQHPTTALEYLSGRSWQGLQVDSGDTEVKKVVEGRRGIAMNYTHEPEQ